MEWQPSIQALSLTPETTLPPLMLTPLSSWGAIELTGDDRKSYLQGQVTCDVVSLEAQQSTLGAHCDAKGKAWSVFRLFHTEQGYAMFQPLSAIAQELVELKKYAIFSKVEFTQSSKACIGVMGAQAQAWVDEHFPSTGDVRQQNGSSAVRIDETRWLVLASDELIESLDAQDTQWVQESIWTQFDIDAALPTLNAEQQNQHIPQAFNLQALDGISFTKGCYTGQETVARAKYRGINKRMLATLTGRLTAAVADDEEIIIERSVGDNWRKAGDVVNVFQYDDHTFKASIIINNNLDDDVEFRLASQPDSRLTLSLPPYSLDSE
ncbi:tRNA-modifying protein YgfZ [Vibrio variabilis]|uniref:tRNA-modifying protein YgfZ n=1 Tax=Vibrio variabilis TaxID=990271 RepID=UPI000DD91009|nr:tRNA-modifying protein YgfZ [Vibrio variabilis]